MFIGNRPLDFHMNVLSLTEAETPRKNVSLAKEKVKVVPLMKGRFFCLYNLY